MSVNTLIPAGRAAVATLVATEGSSPKEPGARMWVDESGTVVGAVTIGGCVDARVIEESAAVLASGKPALLRLPLGEEDAWALGMTCAGTVTVLVEPVDATSPHDNAASALGAAANEVEAGRRAVLVAALDGRPGRVLVRSDGSSAGTLGDPGRDSAVTAVALRRLGSDESSGVEGVTWDEAGGARAAADHYFELHAPPATLVVFGATHVAMPLVELAAIVGLRTVVVDARERFATRERFPGVDELIVGMPSEIASRLALGPSSLVVLLSHDYKHDLPVLRVVLESDARYVGCLGSTRRGRAMLDFLAESGVSPERLARVTIPVGLDIGARSAPEIALAVLAEGLAALRGRAGGAMRNRRAPGTAG